MPRKGSGTGTSGGAPNGFGISAGPTLTGGRLTSGESMLPATGGADGLPALAAASIDAGVATLAVGASAVGASEDAARAAPTRFPAGAARSTSAMIPSAAEIATL